MVWKLVLWKIFIYECIKVLLFFFFELWIDSKVDGGSKQQGVVVLGFCVKWWMWELVVMLGINGYWRVLFLEVDMM